MENMVGVVRQEKNWKKKTPHNKKTWKKVENLNFSIEGDKVDLKIGK